MNELKHFMMLECFKLCRTLYNIMYYLNEHARVVDRGRTWMNELKHLMMLLCGA